MIHDSNNFKLSDIGLSCENPGNADDDIVGTITFNGKRFDYNRSPRLCLARDAKISKGKSQQRYRIDYNNGQMCSANERIVLILESPSVSEFSIQRPCPAWGKTGDRINSQLIPLLNRCLNVCFPIHPNANTSFDIVIMNAIRYQCDLGNKGNRIIINSVFNQLWNCIQNPFSDDLVERIKFVSPALIINACTSSNGSKLCTTSFLKNQLTNIRIVEASSHPSVWGKGSILF